MRKKSVFVIGLDEHNRRLMQTIRGADRYDIHGLLRHEEVEHRETYPIEDMLAAAEAGLRGAEGPVDAVVNYIDFPGNSMAAILAGRFGLRGPSLRAVLRCEHKVWSRACQAEALPGHVPRYAPFNPFDDDPLAAIDLPFPFWIKPVKGFGSYLAYRVGNAHDFRRDLAVIRDNIHRLADPFDRLLDRVTMPDAVAPVRGYWCVAEEILQGRQCTVEGYVLDGDVRVHGIIDSIRYPNRTSFARYQYPSQLPQRIQRAVTDMARRCVARFGLDNTGYNIEFFWDQTCDRIAILEVNPRISQSHCALFARVDGASSHQIIIAVALGEEPAFPRREGPYRYAAKCFLRHMGDAFVTRVPHAGEIAAIERAVPGTTIRVTVPEGRRLSERTYSESYSCTLAQLFIGGADPADINRKYRECERRLPFELA